MARAKKPAKKATKKATPKRKAKAAVTTQSTQLQVLSEARKVFDGRIIVMGELDNTVPGYTSTQSLALDWMSGQGGLPQSRIIDVTSDEGCGKSTFGDHVMAEIQRQDGHAYLWDTENARDQVYQAKIGIARKRAGQIDAHTMEEGFQTMIDLVSWHNANDPDRPGVIVWDTPAGTPTKNEVDIEKTNERFGPAKIIRTYLRTLNQQLQQGRWMLFVCNQTYMGHSPGGQAYKAAYGGGGIPYYSSMRFSLSHPSRFWRNTVDKKMGYPPVGQTVWVKCIKNRVAVPWKSKQICIHFGEGINNTYEIFQTMVGAGCIKAAGAGWCSFDPDHSPELAAKYPKSFQASTEQGGHMVLNDLITAEGNEAMWTDLLKVYHEIIGGMQQ